MQAEFLIAMLVIVGEQPAVWSRVEIETQLSDLSPLQISDALAHLEAEGVVLLDGEHVECSRCARHLDALGMIAI